MKKIRQIFTKRVRAGIYFWIYGVVVVTFLTENVGTILAFAIGSIPGIAGMCFTYVGKDEYLN